MIENNFDFEEREPDTTDYVWCIDRLIEFLIQEMDNDERMKESFQAFLDEWGYEFKVEDFMQAK